VTGALGAWARPHPPQVEIVATSPAIDRLIDLVAGARGR